MVCPNQMACNGMPSSFSFFPSNFHVQLQAQNEPQDHQQFTHSSSIFSLPSNTQEFKGVEEDDYDDDYSKGGEKKMRLNIEQVRTLEKNFEVGNKLEPERKMQLARAIGLQPRQVAIWFQNRRARCKTKQLEKDYDVLKRQVDSLESENSALQAQNTKLQAEIMALKRRDTSELINLNIKQSDSCSSEINFDVSRTSTIDSSLNHQQSVPFFASIGPLSNSMVQVSDENFSNFLCNIDDQSTWTW